MLSGRTLLLLATSVSIISLTTLATYICHHYHCHHICHHCHQFSLLSVTIVTRLRPSWYFQGSVRVSTLWDGLCTAGTGGLSVTVRTRVCSCVARSPVYLARCAVQTAAGVSTLPGCVTDSPTAEMDLTKTIVQVILWDVCVNNQIAKSSIS